MSFEISGKITEIKEPVRYLLIFVAMSLMESIILI
jgi:hypothetical protein